MEVSKKSAAKIGLVGAVSMIISAMIGIGIFFKNNGVFSNNNNNSVGILISWILAFIIAFATAYAFGEIALSKNKSANSGLAGWTENFIGEKAGRFLKISQPSFYYVVYVFVLSIFASEALWNCFMDVPGQINVSDYNFVFVMLTALGLVAFFGALNYISFKTSENIGKTANIIKFIPLIAVVFVGIICGCINPEHNFFTGHIGDESGKFSIQGVFISLPAILFAFDSFLIVGNVASNVKEPEKNIPLSIIISLIISGTIYFLFTIGQICVGAGSAYEVFESIFGVGSTGATISAVIISIFILIAILGCLNALVAASIRSMQSSIDEEKMAFSKQLKKIGNGKKLVGGIIAIGVLYSFFWVAFAIPSCILQTDAIVDALSNVVVVAYFAIYATVVLFALINRKTNRVEVKKTKGFVPMAIISIIGVYFVIGYLCFYEYSIANIWNANDAYGAWGLFAGIVVDSEGISSIVPGLTYWQASICFWALTLVFVGAPFVNDLLIKFTDKNYNQPLLWEKSCSKNASIQSNNK